MPQKNTPPTVPGDTCPYIDFVLEEIDGLKLDESDDFGEAQLALIRQMMEYIRSANQQLRTSSWYWRQQAKNQTKKIAKSKGVNTKSKPGRSLGTTGGGRAQKVANEIAEMWENGDSASTIAETLDISPSSVYRILNSL